jgi:galactose-1-phosphate uridylyltransferase
MAEIEPAVCHGFDLAVGLKDATHDFSNTAQIVATISTYRADRNVKHTVSLLYGLVELTPQIYQSTAQIEISTHEWPRS